MRHWIIAGLAIALLSATPAGAADTTAEEMAQRVASSLRDSGELSNYRVGVKYEEGVAWLLGTVTSQEQSATAMRLASQIEGIDHVVNKLEVKQPTAKAPRPTIDASFKPAALESPEAAPLPTPSAMPKVAARPVPTKRTPVGRQGMPRPIRRASMDQPVHAAQYGGTMPTPQGYSTGGAAGVSYDQANMPGYAWPSYAAHPNYSALTYPKQYSPSAWPYIGPFYPYPQVPLGWRKVTLEWDDGWWNLDFSHHKGH